MTIPSRLPCPPVLAVAAMLSWATPTPLRAVDTGGNSCRFKADGSHGQTVSIPVAPGSPTATVSAALDGLLERSGADEYTADQLRGLHAVILIQANGGDPAYADSPDTQLACMSRMIAAALRELGEQPN